MRQSKFPETQLVSMLKEADASRPANAIWRTEGISAPTYSKWTATDGGVEASDMKRLRELEEEHSKLKRLDADLALDKALQVKRRSIVDFGNKGVPGLASMTVTF